MNMTQAAATNAEVVAGLSGASMISATGRMSASTEIRQTRAASAMLMETRKMSTNKYEDPSGQFDEHAEFDDCDDDFPFDCGMDRSGQCSMAGSEDCDFECPVMADIHRVARLQEIAAALRASLRKTK